MRRYIAHPRRAQDHLIRQHRPDDGLGQIIAIVIAAMLVVSDLSPVPRGLSSPGQSERAER